jgi:NarL family two-component system sensor histidine kinase LiaS
MRSGAELVARWWGIGMSWLLRPFRTLQWRLTLTYIMVTVLTVLTLEVALLVAFDIAVLNAPETPVSLVQQIQPIANQSAPYLAKKPLNTDVLELQLQINDNNRYFLSTSFGFAPRIADSELMMLLDARGKIIAATYSDAKAPGPTATPTTTPTADMLQARNLPQSQAVIAAALAGSQNENALRKTLPDGNTIVVAVPIEDANNHVLGALFVEVVATPSKPSILFSRSWIVLIPSAILLTLGALFVGSIFGLLTARWLTRRLRILMGAANSWSQGDFSAIARDTTNDELGQLARHLNSMAAQIDALLHERQDLAVIEERNRLARDLHDSVKQQVFATAMQLAAAHSLIDRDPQAARAHVIEAETLTGQAQQELTALIRELRPVALEDTGLAGALERHAADWSRQTGISATVRAQGEQPTPLETEQALFRVAQEALSNIARHSDATNVDLRLVWEPETLTLTIRDNGHGFDVERANGKGTGLWSMRQRVELLGGTLQIISPAPGTRIAARVPFAPEARFSNPGLAAISGGGASRPASRPESQARKPDTTKPQAAGTAGRAEGER